MTETEVSRGEETTPDECHSSVPPFFADVPLSFLRGQGKLLRRRLLFNKAISCFIAICRNTSKTSEMGLMGVSGGLSFQFPLFQIRRGTSTRILKQTLARDRTEEMG